MTYQSWRKVHGRTQMSGAGFVVPVVGGGDPTSVSGLVLWLKADSLSLSDGDPVTTWTDSSGNGNSGTGTGTNKPKYKVSQLNSLPGILFDIGSAADQHFTLPNFASAFTSGEIFLMLKANADPAVAVDDTGLMYIGEADFGGHYPYTDGTVYESFGSSARKTVGDPTPSLTSFSLYNVRSAASDFEVFLNSSSIFSTATNTVAFTTTPKIGNNQAGSGFKGVICELAMYNKGLNSTERSTIRTYFTGRYGVP